MPFPQTQVDYSKLTSRQGTLGRSLGRNTPETSTAKKMTGKVSTTSRYDSTGIRVIPKVQSHDLFPSISLCIPVPNGGNKAFAGPRHTYTDLKRRQHVHQHF